MVYINLVDILDDILDVRGYEKYENNLHTQEYEENKLVRVYEV